MFDFLLSEEKKMRRHAANWLEVAQRVWNFRRDQLTPAESQSLQAATGELVSRLKDKAEASKLKLSIEKLEGVLGKVGGRHYPMGTLAENVEFFLVAALVILGLRAYFVQPFKIPTNSMWPSYYGMTHELFKEGEEPGVLGSVGRFLTLGATRYRITAPADGEVMAPVFSNLQLAYTTKPGRFLGVFPTTVREYTFAVNGEQTDVTVPAEFDLQRVFDEKYTGRRGGLRQKFQQWLAKNGNRVESSVLNVNLGGRVMDQRVYWLPLGQKVQKGKSIAAFDILTGDLLFVDRITYNFLPPKVGQGFVFKTENIHSDYMQDAAGRQIRQYYIKRLVGLPGDILEVKPPVLFRNRRPIEGAAAFAHNFRQEGKYPGYTNELLLAAGRETEVPAHSYFAMGDNSPESADSRYWGFVPEKDVVGKPLFIYYPLTTRWGLAN
ncbi:MAG: signal peptidase I [Opitutales bacterium]